MKNELNNARQCLRHIKKHQFTVVDFDKTMINANKSAKNDIIE